MQEVLGMTVISFRREFTLVQTSRIASTLNAAAQIPLSFTLHLKPCVKSQNQDWASVPFLSLFGIGSMCSHCDKKRVMNMTVTHFVPSHCLKRCLRKLKTGDMHLFYQLGSRQVHVQCTVVIILKKMNCRVSTKVNVQAGKLLDWNYWVRITGTLWHLFLFPDVI